MCQLGGWVNCRLVASFAETINIVSFLILPIVQFVNLKTNFFQIPELLVHFLPVHLNHSRQN